MKAGLYLVPTPIGNLGDMTFRAIEVLQSVSEIWSEDTRNTRKLLNYFDISIQNRRVLACHDHNEHEMAARMVEQIQSGVSIAYVSDAGMPLISDPGYRLVQAAQAADLFYTALPGASAVPTALALSGLASNRFAFLGFVPQKESKRLEMFEEIKLLKMSAIVFDSPKRVVRNLEFAKSVLGGASEVALVREISKTYEEIVNGTLEQVTAALEGRQLKGEIVVVFAPVQQLETSDETLRNTLISVLERERIKDAVKIVSERFGVARNRVYDLALEIVKQNRDR